MNYYQIVAFAQHLKKQNMNNNNPFIDDAYNEESKLYGEFMDEVKLHDYSYMMSDDHRSWASGMRHEKEIQAKIHALCAVHREDAEALYREVIELVQEQYVDGLTHKVIKGWFSPYIGE